MEKSGIVQCWELIKKDIDPDIIEALERDVKDETIGNSNPAYAYMHDPMLTIVNLQLLRELKRGTRSDEHYPILIQETHPKPGNTC